MKKSLVMLPLAAMSFVALASCGKNKEYSIQEYIMANALDSMNLEKSYASYNKIVIPEGGKVSSDGCFIINRTDDACYVYSAATGKEIVQASKDCYAYSYDYYYPFLTVEENDLSSYYDKYGNLLAKDTGSVTYSLDSMYFPGSSELYGMPVVLGSDGSEKIYVHEGSNLVQIFESEKTTDIMPLYYYGSENILQLLCEENNNVYNIIDSEAKIIGSVKLKGNESCEAVNYDQMIVQEALPLEDDATDYDYISEGKKYDLETYAINFNTGKTTNLEWNYVFDYVVSMKTPEKYYTSAIYAREINNKELSDEREYYIVGKKGTILGEIPDDVNQPIYKIGENYLQNNTLYTSEREKICSFTYAEACGSYVFDEPMNTLTDFSGKSAVSGKVTYAECLGSNDIYTYYHLTVDGEEKFYTEELKNPGTLTERILDFTWDENQYLGAGNSVVHDDSYYYIENITGTKIRMCPVQDEESIEYFFESESLEGKMVYVKAFDSESREYHYYIYQ